jgi:Na+-driven multidrug efflux pump
MASKTPHKTLLSLAWPLIVSFTIRSLLSSIDMIYAGQLSDSAVAAIGLFFPIEFTFIAFWVGTSAALTSYLSKAMGERHEGQLRQLSGTCARVVIALSLFFLLLAGVLWVAAPHLPFEEDVLRDFRVYGTTAMAGIALCAFWSILPDSLVKAHHDTRSTMIAGLISGVLNVILNTVFMLGFGWGVFGIGLATGLARLGSLLYALHRARVLEAARVEDWAATPPPRKRRGKRAGYTAEGLLNRPLAALLALGVPSALTYVLMSTEGFLVNAVLAGMGDSTAAIAAYAIYHRSVMLALMPIIAVGVAVLPFVARLVAEKRFDEVRAQLRGAFLLGVAYVLLVATPLAFFASEPLATFLSEAESTRRLAVFAIRYGTPLAALSGVPFILSRPAFEALQRGAPGLSMAFLRYVLLSAPLAFGGAAYARAHGEEPFFGLIAGLLVGSAIVGLLFAGWLARTLHTLGRDKG